MADPNATPASRSYYDAQKAFLYGVTVRDIAEPLPSFDDATPARAVEAVMSARGYEVAGVRCCGMVAGYILAGELDDGACGEYMHLFAEGQVIEHSATLTEVIRALSDSPLAFVRILGHVGGLVTRADLQDPPARMWLFGLVTAIETGFQQLIENHLSDESWTKYLSPERLAKARELQEERLRRNYQPTLIDCLQFADKGQIVARDQRLRQIAGFPSRRRADYAIKILEALRNNLAHAQDIAVTDWDTIALLAEKLERVVAILAPR